ncbi:MerR family DNA-binding transcriptional regulator [Nocardioides sp. QY071]|uniref:MerR family DNA-binding transcriptional regulator n=1 Tax=Nocardioides sp. QY071 TaxID=3044187 RepID=UPI00249C5521|nr:MerR family DNA-binding transcriptional regulator [Nocardioides sp. QY071]WGY01795.1 MerR family DNA-binding transcriptional regulator [Nocardioides sp. QY071]
MRTCWRRWSTVLTRRDGEPARRGGAAAGGVHRETLHYYERRSLLGDPDHSPGGHRLYDVQS